MIVYSVMPVSFRCHETSKLAKEVKNVGQDLVEQAKLELEKISCEKGSAGTETAWWRDGFHEAEKILRDIADGKDPSSDIYNKSYAQRFHDYDEDGFI